jgi:hypothetical protein
VPADCPLDRFGEVGATGASGRPWPPSVSVTASDTADVAGVRRTWRPVSPADLLGESLVRAVRAEAPESAASRQMTTPQAADGGVQQPPLTAAANPARHRVGARAGGGYSPVGATVSVGRGTGVPIATRDTITPRPQPDHCDKRPPRRHD